MNDCKWIFLLMLALSGGGVYAQSASNDPLTYVDPFIGTAKSDVITRWGNEGGTYPGAVAPWGAMQLTPETRMSGGYDHRDSTIFFFSCYHHMSGYPNGSAGRMRIMPVGRGEGADGVKHGAERPFRHAEETAMPGYYRVRLSDDGTLIEATASEREGMFRMTFPAGEGPKIFINDTMHAAFRFSRPCVERRVSNDGVVLCFSADTNVLLIRVSTAGEVGKMSFDEMRERTQADWRRQLKVIEVDDDDAIHKKIFYTALYHSMLLPWIVSGAGQPNRYGGFSPWDTFRSLHPLLCLLFPDRQRDMVLSMMDIYRKTGYLPSDPMTGNHAAAVIADSRAKGIPGTDSAEAFMAMRKGVIDTPYRQDDMEVYRRLGYIPSTYPESVTRTVEYAYDDWVISKGATGYNYRNLFDQASLFILPQGGERGNNGYKEGDKWVYSYFVPQAPYDLVNLMGGAKEFALRLDGALRRGDILFDNETVFHIPYLFNYAGAAGKTQEWVRAIRDGRFAAAPGGLPGNDDLGAMSSWYIFSALGFYPMCPGRPVYDIGTPLFRKVTLHLSGGHDLALRAPSLSDRNKYVRGVKIDGKSFGELQLSHAAMMKAHEIVFEMGTAAFRGSEHGPERAAFSFSGVTVSKRRLVSNELFRIRWKIKGNTNTGTRIVRLRVNGKQYAYKNCLVPAGQTLSDSMDCRLYALGKAGLDIEGTDWRQDVEVIKEGELRSEVSDVFVQPLVKEGDGVRLSYKVRNIGGAARLIVTPVKVDGEIVRVDSSWLAPGEARAAAMVLPAFQGGWKQLQAGDKEVKFNVYNHAEESILLDISAGGKDRSGFGHDVKIVGRGPAFGKDCFMEVVNDASLDSMGETLTMMLWVYPTEKGGGLVDIFTKGDNHVLQIGGNRTLSFFAGGWGRGDCTVDLPSDWWGRWHHIAGVCEGSVLKVYIDGVLKGTSTVEGRVNLSVPNRWVLGRNEEFPGQRIFSGYIDGARVFTEPLTGEEIRHLYQSSGVPPSPQR